MCYALKIGILILLGIQGHHLSVCVIKSSQYIDLLVEQFGEGPSYQYTTYEDIKGIYQCGWEDFSASIIVTPLIVFGNGAKPI